MLKFWSYSGFLQWPCLGSFLWCCLQMFFKAPWIDLFIYFLSRRIKSCLYETLGWIMIMLRIFIFMFRTWSFIEVLILFYLVYEFLKYILIFPWFQDSFSYWSPFLTAKPVFSCCWYMFLFQLWGRLYCFLSWKLPILLWYGDWTFIYCAQHIIDDLMGSHYDFFNHRGSFMISDSKW